MRRWQAMLTMLAMAGLAATTYASEASTSAGASSGWGRRDGSAQATAHYEGDMGLARTQTHSGKVSTARGVALGVDEDGVSFSISHAVAPRNGPAVGATLSVSVDRDGDVNTSVGSSVARGGYAREVEVASATSTDRGTPSRAIASGRTYGGGRVDARVRSTSDDDRSLRRVAAPRRDVSRYR